MKILLSLVLFSTSAGAQLAKPDPRVQAVCSTFAEAALPPELLGLSAPKTYPVCDSYSFYEAGNFTAALSCATQERLALLAHLPGSPDPQQPAGGMIVLAQLYANAERVARNLPFAAHALCEAVDTGEILSSPMQTKKILATLAHVQTLTSASPRFYLCDTETGTPAPDAPLTRQCQQIAQETHPPSRPTRANHPR